MTRAPGTPSTTTEFGSNYDQNWTIEATRWPNRNGFLVEIRYETEEAKKQGEDFFKEYLEKHFNPNRIEVTWYPSEEALYAAERSYSPSVRQNIW